MLSLWPGARVVNFNECQHRTRAVEPAPFVYPGALPFPKARCQRSGAFTGPSGETSGDAFKTRAARPAELCRALAEAIVARGRQACPRS
eukprot:15465833-Alexandrium_andersonii.AAC.1